MNITIRPLTPELSDDYFDFFENRAFTDNSPYRWLLPGEAEGYQDVVSFPVVRSERYEWDCQGPVRLYEKAGFVKTARCL